MRPHTLSSLEPRGMSLGTRQPRANPADVAAHLARFNGRPLETLALCLIHWHGGIPHHRPGAEALLMEMAHQIIRRQTDKITEAALNLEKFSVNGRADECEKLQRHLDQLKEERWPESKDGKYLHLFRGAFDEFKQPVLCTKCEGRGHIEPKYNAPASECDRCNKTGREPKSANARAHLCGVHPYSYSQHWFRPYIWTLAEISSAYRRAANELEND